MKTYFYKHFEAEPSEENLAGVQKACQNSTPRAAPIIIAQIVDFFYIYL